MINKLLLKEMKKQKLTYASLSRKCDIHPKTVQSALEDDGKLSVYEKIAKALNKTIKYTVE